MGSHNQIMRDVEEKLDDLTDYLETDRVGLDKLEALTAAATKLAAEILASWDRDRGYMSVTYLKEKEKKK